ncbi:hypothetical protein SLEP1_g34695 [Rubroshorea leprosula]|uniref:Uncharacterized protein n=1 Tax=Rubroshorea leprosula TaxID=152421 RepID=A0AAV5KKT7_9ROSI|nr:hypothetical protein SLEP1_g34695 [Rubroshorea leprosula]
MSLAHMGYSVHATAIFRFQMLPLPSTSSDTKLTPFIQKP